MPEDANTGGSSAVEDTGASASTSTPVETSTPSTPAPETGDTSSTTAPQQASEPTQQAGSEQTQQPLTSEQAEQGAQPSAQAQGEPQQNWQERYKHLQAYADRRHNTFMQNQQKMQRELQQLQAEREKWTKQQAAKPWQPEHPEHAKFGGLLERAQTIHRQLQALDQRADLTPEQATAAKVAIMAGVTPDEHKALQTYQEETQAFQRDLFINPDKALAPIIERQAKALFERHMADQQGRQQVAQDFAQPHVQAVMKDPTYRTYLQEKLQQGVPYDAAMEMMKLRAATDLMHRRLTGSQRTVVQAQEQARLAQGRAATAVSADPVSTEPDPYGLAMNEAKRRGIAPGSPQFNKLIDKYTTR